MQNDATTLIVMTGATSGIGLEAVRVLLRSPDVRLIVGARRPEQADALRAAVPADRLILLPLDTSSLASVHAFADAVDGRRDGVPISALALNAGVQSGPQLELTADGIERTVATNFLGHAVLAERLAPALAPDAAVVMTASQSHDPADRVARLLGYRGGVFPNAAAVLRGTLDPSSSPAQAARDRYATSKLCCLLWTFAKARETSEGGIRHLAYDPGTVPATDIARNLGVVSRYAWTRVLPRLVPLVPSFTTPQASGLALSRLLTSPKTAPSSGLYLNYRLQPANLWVEAKRTDWQDDLMRTISGLMRRG